jgi:hypothetical protein
MQLFLSDSVRVTSYTEKVLYRLFCIRCATLQDVTVPVISCKNAINICRITNCSSPQTLYCFNILYDNVRYQFLLATSRLIPPVTNTITLPLSYAVCTEHFIVSLSQNQQLHKIINKYKMYLQSLHMFRQKKLPSSGGIYQRITNTYCIQIHDTWFYSRRIYAAHDFKMYTSRCIKL